MSSHPSGEPEMPRAVAETLRRGAHDLRNAVTALFGVMEDVEEWDAPRGKAAREALAETAQRILQVADRLTHAHPQGKPAPHGRR